jgi:hypothetical protein
MTDTIHQTSKLQAAGKVLRITGFLDFVHCLEFGIPEHAPFRICFCYQVRGRRHLLLLGPLERANLDWSSISKGSTEYVSCSTHLRTERNPVSETLCFLVFWIPEGEHSPEPSNSECYTPVSEHFRFCKESAVCYLHSFLSMAWRQNQYIPHEFQ